MSEKKASAPKLRGLGAPPPTDVASNNLAPGPKVSRNVNFKISPEFHRELKMASADRGITLVRLLEEMFTDWKNKTGWGIK